MLAGSSPVKGTKNKGESMFSNVTGQIGTVVDDGTLPNTTGSLTTDGIAAAVKSNNYVTFTDNCINNLDASSRVIIDPGLSGYHTCITPSSYNIPYSLMDRHKTYKLINSFMSEYRKHKRKYKINITEWSNYANNSIIDMHTNITLHVQLVNKDNNQTEPIEKISQYASPIIENCIMNFLCEHAEELMEKIEEATKKDVVEFAKQEGKKMKESLELVEIIQKLGD